MPNDFLSHLSSRVLQPSEVDASGSELKPRLASRFESTVLAGLTVGQAPEQESPVEVEAGNDVSFMPPVPDRIPVRDQEPAPNQEWMSGLPDVREHRHEESKRSFESDGKPAVKQVPAAEPSDTLPRHFVLTPAQNAELPNLARNDAMAVQPTTFLSTPGNSPRVETQQIIENHTTIIEMHSPSIDPKKGIQTSVPPVPSSQTKLVPERIEVTRIERQTQVPPTGAQIVPSLEMPRLNSQSKLPDAQQQPPTIHVTIGRIEVKAAPPAAAPKRHTPTSPTMSLDEYLHRRSGGER